MLITRISKKFLKVTAFIFGGIVLVLTSFHFWFVNHAERLIEDMVEVRSNGKLKLDVEKFRFNWFSYDMELRNAVFYSADTTAATSYRFSVRSMHITVKEIIPLVFEKRIIIDSLRLLDPDIRVTRLRAPRSDTSESTPVSLPQEMGRVYNSIQDALDVLKVDKFHIDNGKFTLENLVQPDQLPVTITNIDFHLVNLVVDSTERSGSQILFSDNVAMHTYDQDILFPDGRHRLQFSNFRINLQNRMVEFDSCTLTAMKGDSANSSFTIFFDKLLLTNIDFDTLYRTEVIKADSVYCINPRFRLDVELPSRDSERKPPPKLNELIQQLTGDLQLEFVIVQNGAFDINTIRDGEPSSFTSTNNNFELQGLRIQESSPKPLTVRSFAMAIRNYENFLGDSTYAMQFDSVHLINNSIFLSNFSLEQMRNGRTVNSFKMPRFELRGLSWDDLVFEQRLSATFASLYSPVIHYTVPGNRPGRKQDVFETLAGFGRIIELNQLDINNGDINILFNGNSSLRLQNADASLLGRRLAGSKSYQSIKESIRRLRFEKGVLRLNDIVAEMDDMTFNGYDGSLTARTATVKNDAGDLQVEAEGVGVRSIVIDNDSGVSEIDGLTWQKAHINFTAGGGSEDAKYFLSNLRGNNTTLNIRGKDFSFTTFQESIALDKFISGKPGGLRAENFTTRGRDFDLTKGNARLFVREYSLADKDNSALANLSYSYQSLADTIEARVPSMSFQPDLNAALNGRLVAKEVNIVQPEIDILHSSAGESKAFPFPIVDIGSIRLNQPSIRVRLPSEHVSSIKWSTGEGKDFVDVTGLKIDTTDGIRASDLRFLIHSLRLQILNKSFGTGDGNVSGHLSDLSIKRDTSLHWNGRVKDLQVAEIKFDSLGPNLGKVNIDHARLNDLDIGSGSFSNIQKLVRENGAFRIGEITGSYRNKEMSYRWNNVSFDKYTKTFSLDSFSMEPVISRDSFMASSQWQTDYMRIRTGRVVAGPFDLDTYLADTIINAGRITIHDAFLSSYRDKRLPFKGGVVKPMPAFALKKLPVRLSVDSLSLNNASVEYLELNEETGRVGRVHLTGLNAEVRPVRNFRFDANDSLLIQAEATMNEKIRFNLRMKESITDSLSGFNLHANVSPFNASTLNPLIGPLASVKVRSGYLDTLVMRVSGNKYVATGEIDMYYHNLRIAFLNKDGRERKGLFRGMKNFFANTFVIKNNNRSGTDPVFLQRNLEKSAINYLVKITLSGLGHTIGIRNNKKLERQFKKEQPERNLPEVHYD